MHGLPIAMRVRAGVLLPAGLGLVTLVAAGPVAAQAERSGPLGRPVAEAPTTAAQAVDSLIAAGVAPGADERASVPGWALGPVLGLERTLAADVAADAVGSIAAAVVVGDRVVWAAAFGRADREAGTLAAPGTIYRTGSITKPITALVLLSLVERGTIALDDPVEPYLPELERLANRAPDHGSIRFRDLAAHTAGLAREPAASHAGRGPVREWRRKVVDALPATVTIDRPGAAYHYSNLGYALLGLALERAAGQPFESLVQELVFDPLGMTSSYFVVPPRERHRLAAGYVNPTPDSIDPRVPRAEHRGRGYRVPSGGVYSTVGDLARLAMGMTGALGDSPLSAYARAEALADRAAKADGTVSAAGPETGTGVGPGSGYGLGFQILRLGDTRIAGHSGAVAGYTAYLAFDPATRVAVVLLRNYNHGATNLGATAARVILDLAHRSPADRTAKP
jgi:CubicO group peptidase (beta-lactamase class C family)